MSEWTAFFGAEVAAAAALAGLVFVGVSINLDKILKTPGLSGRAAEAVIVLLAVLIVASLLLVPGQRTAFIGIELLVAGLTVWAGLVTIHWAAFRDWAAKYPAPFVVRVALGQGATLPLVVAGIAVLLQGTGGVYWTVPAVVCSFGLAFLAAWSLLIEINR